MQQSPGFFLLGSIREDIHLVISSGGEAGVEKSAAQPVGTGRDGRGVKSESGSMGFGGAWEGD